MSILPIAWSESFDRGNPLVLRVALGRGGGGRICWRDSLPVVAWWTLPVVVLLWVAGTLHARAHDMEVGAGEPLALAADVSNYLLLMAAFGAPAAGVGARFRIDRSPILGDLLMSGLGWRRIAAAMHGRILVGGAFALLLALTVAVFLAWAILDPMQSASQAINSSRLALVTGYVPVLRPGVQLSLAAKAAALAMMAAMVVNFAAGFLARASINAAIGATGPAPVLLTTVLVLSAMGSYVVRWEAPTAIAGWVRIAPPDAVLFSVHAAIELAGAALRLLMMRRAWQRILGRGEAECRARLGWE